jgi:RNA recognition motif-containing protein
VNFERERDLFEAQRKETGTEVRVFVGNLDPKTDEDILRSYFVKFGPLKNVFVLRNPDGTSKRSGFVTFYYTSQAKLACDEMNNKYKDSVRLLLTS